MLHKRSRSPFDSLAILGALEASAPQMEYSCDNCNFAQAKQISYTHCVMSAAASRPEQCGFVCGGSVGLSTPQPRAHHRLSFRRRGDSQLCWAYPAHPIDTLAPTILPPTLPSLRAAPSRTQGGAEMIASLAPHWFPTILPPTLLSPRAAPVEPKGALR